MKFVLALLLVVPAVLVLANPADASCGDNSFYPLSPGTIRTYESQTTHRRSMYKVLTVVPPVVTAEGRDLSNPSAPTGTVTFTCVPTGIVFDVAQATTSTASAKITNVSGQTIPLPDQFKVFGTAGPGVGQWSHKYKLDVSNGVPNGPTISMTTDIEETSTIEAQNVTVHPPAAPSQGWPAFRIKVETKSTTGIVSGVSSGVTLPPIPPTTKVSYEWIVENVGLVQYGPLAGPYTQLINCGTAACPTP